MKKKDETGNEKKHNPVMIRDANKKDLDGIIEVENACFPEGIRYSREKIASRLNSQKDSSQPERKYFVAEQKGKIIGYGEVSLQHPEMTLFGNISVVEKNIGKIDDVIGALISTGVHPSHQGKGIGSLILEKRLEYLKSKGIRQVFTHAWPNGGFIRLASKFGFKEIREWKGLAYCDGTKAILFYKSLS